MNRRSFFGKLLAPVVGVIAAKVSDDLPGAELRPWEESVVEWGDKLYTCDAGWSEDSLIRFARPASDLLDDAKCIEIYNSLNLDGLFVNDVEVAS